MVKQNCCAVPSYPVTKTIENNLNHLQLLSAPIYLIVSDLSKKGTEKYKNKA